MTSGATITVEGDKRLQSTMHAAGRDIGAMDLTASAQRVARDASSKAPRLTGTLASSIRASYHGGDTATIGSDVIYAGRTEYGWSKVGQAARPFLRPALADNAPAVVRDAEQEAAKALKQVKGA